MALLGELAIGITANTAGFTDGIKRSRKEAAEFRKDMTDVGRVLDALKTPQDRYNDGLARLDDLHKKGRLTSEQLREAQQKLGEELDATRGSLDKTAESANKAFGDKALTAVGQYAASIGVIATAAKAATEAINAMKAAGDRGAEAIRDREEVFARFAQVITPEGGAGDVRKMADMAGNLQKETGMSIKQAGSLVFDAESGGFTDQVSQVGRTLPILQDASAVGLIAGKTRGLFKDKLTPMQALAMTLEAAGQSPADFAQLGSALPMAAESSAGSGTGAAETMATLAELSKVFGTSMTAAERIKAFSAKVAKDDRFNSGGIVEAARRLQVSSPEVQKEILGGNEEAMAAMNRIAELSPSIRATQKRIEAEGSRAKGGRSILEAKVLAFEGTPEMMALKKAKVETMMADGSLIGEGERALLFEAARQRGMRTAADEGGAAALTAFGMGEGIVGTGAARAALRPQLDAAAERNQAEAAQKQQEANAILTEIANGIKEQNRRAAAETEVPSL